MQLKTTIPLFFLIAILSSCYNKITTTDRKHATPIEEGSPVNSDDPLLKINQDVFTILSYDNKPIKISNSIVSLPPGIHNFKLKSRIHYTKREVISRSKHYDGTETRLTKSGPAIFTSTDTISYNFIKNKYYYISYNVPNENFKVSITRYTYFHNTKGGDILGGIFWGIGAITGIWLLFLIF